MHYLKASEKERSASFYRISQVGGGAKEAEASLFAGALLMPRKEYSETYQLLEGDLSRLAETFHVSVPTAEIRASVLKLNQ